MKEAIRQWLNGKRDAESGLKIIATINKDDARSISRSHYADLNKKIFSYLLNIYKNAESSQPYTERHADNGNTISKNDNPQKRSIDSKRISSANTNTAVAESAKKEADKLYKEMSNARAQLFALCPAKQERFENEGQFVETREGLAKEVIRLQYAVDEAYDTYRFACEHGRLPEKPKQEPAPQDMYRMITNLRKSISKLKNSKKPLTPAQSERLQSKQVELEKLLKAYDN